MKAMVLQQLCSLDQNQLPLALMNLPVPEPRKNDILVRVSACGVCHTELDEIEGRTPPPRLPIVPGHQAVGLVAAVGSSASRFKIGDRVGIAWIYSACGSCASCLEGNENLCHEFVATGRDVDGGYAQYMTVTEAFAHRIPVGLQDIEAAPLLCAGAIGYRSLKLTGLTDGQNMGLSGFGGSGHLVLKMVKYRYPNTQIFVFARSESERAFALELGANWSGDVTENAPEKLHCVIDTTPAWKPIVSSLRNLLPGGRLVINAIRKEDRDKDYLMELDYPEHLWMEKEIKSVANVSREDVSEFLSLAADIGIKPEIQTYPLAEANRALVDLSTKAVKGAKVLVVD